MLPPSTNRTEVRHDCRSIVSPTTGASLRYGDRGWDLPLNDDLLREVKDDHQQLCGLVAAC